MAQEIDNDFFEKLKELATKQIHARQTPTRLQQFLDMLDGKFDLYVKTCPIRDLGVAVEDVPFCCEEQCSKGSEYCWKVWLTGVKEK